MFVFALNNLKVKRGIDLLYKVRNVENTNKVELSGCDYSVLWKNLRTGTVISQ